MAESISANRGDLAEAVLGAAVTARFWLRPEGATVSNQDIKKVLESVIRTNPVKFKRDDLQLTAKITDTITFKVGIPQKAYDFIKQKANWELIPELFRSSTAYVNSDRRLILQSKFLSKNLKVNNILVNADGTGDQTGTKADIKLEVDGKPLAQQISLKVKGGDQFAQVGGLGFDKQLEIWQRLGVDVNPKRSEFEKLYDQIDNKIRFADRNAAAKSKEASLARQAAAVSYKFAAQQLSQKLKRGDEKTIMALAEFIDKGATYGDKSIELVKLVGGSYVRAKFGKQFLQNMKDVAPKLEIVFRGTTADPTVVIYHKEIGSGKAGKLIQVRARYSGESAKNKQGKYYRVYLRNIVEAGDLMFKLATDR